MPRKTITVVRTANNIILWTLWMYILFSSNYPLNYGIGMEINKIDLHNNYQ